MLKLLEDGNFHQLNTDLYDFGVLRKKSGKKYKDNSVKSYGKTYLTALI